MLAVVLVRRLGPWIVEQAATQLDQVFVGGLC
jgi:hypothetical protein